MHRALAKIASAIAALVVFFVTPAALAQNVSLTPTRVVLGDRDRAAEVLILNQSSSPVTYRIDLSEKHMTETGELQAYDDQHQAPANWPSAAAYLRFAPREVTLQPGQSQSVRIAVRRPPDLADGEYRSHMTVTALPAATEAGESVESAAGAGNQGDVRIRLTPIYGVSIPVIMRVGAPAAQSQLANPHLVATPDGGRAMQVDIQRSGNASVYGDLEVDWRANGRDQRVGLIRGVAVYPEISHRTVTIALDLQSLRSAAGGVTVVRYVDNATAANEVVLAEVQGPGL